MDVVRQRAIATALVVLLSATTASAQAAFEAASVKRNTSGAAGGGFDRRPGRFRAINIPLSVIVVMAYNLRHEHFLVGAPDWLSERFDIDAVEPAGAFSPEQRSEMIRGLLRERFKLAARPDTRELPIFNLVMARADARFGPDLQRTKADCAAIRKALAAGARPAPPAGPSSPGQRSECGQANFVDPVRGTTITAGGITMGQFTGTLAGFVTRPVFDRTGLAGDYDVLLRFLPEPGARAVPAGPSASQNAPVPITDAPSVFTALQEQLGLKLEATRGPVEVLVIDSIEPPTEN